MATIETWATEKIAEYGAIYPMVGSEWVWLTVAMVFWLAGWHGTLKRVPPRRKSRRNWRLGDTIETAISRMLASGSTRLRN